MVYTFQMHCFNIVRANSLYLKKREKKRTVSVPLIINKKLSV